MKLLRGQLKTYVNIAMAELAKSYNIEETLPDAKIEYPPKADMGKYATPMAMELARVFKKNPREIALKLIEILNKNEQFSNLITETKILGPGFINFYPNTKGLENFFSADFTVVNWLRQTFDKVANEKVIVEFVSANPTGPLNIVSARAASVGDSICRILKATGIEVFSEYYVNDYGNQVTLLGQSFAYRYLQLHDFTVSLPDNCYQGKYVIDIVKEIELGGEISDALKAESFKNTDTTSADFKEYIEKLADFLGPRGIEKLLAGHKRDLESFNVSFDNFFSEKTLHEEGKVEDVLKLLENKKVIIEKDGAKLFLSTNYGDDKDRVVVRSDSRPTYLLADIAYHKTKIDRGFTKIIDFWGPDHHGYIARLKGAIEVLSGNKNLFDVAIVQQVNLLEAGEQVVMSKRLGKFHTMKDLVDKIPVDVCRYFFVTRSQSTHLDFDIELALTESSQNPVYYIQYAHARIYSILRECNLKKETIDALSFDAQAIDLMLKNKTRDKLTWQLLRYPEELEEVASNLEMQRLATYLYETASCFTHLYHDDNNRIKVLLEFNQDEAQFLLKLILLTAQTLKHGLSLLGISAPERM